MAASNRIETLDAWRGLMALAVVCVHVGVLARYTGIRAGHLAVDIFFLLSGFILTHVYDERRRSGRTSIAAFLLARVRRLLPQHILALGVVIAWTLALAAFGIESDWADDPLFHSDPVAAAGWLLWDLALLSNIIIPSLNFLFEHAPEKLR